MKITDILTESEMQHLEEGPLGDFGTKIGKVAGGVAKGVGAVAGGVAGMGRAFKKGYDTGKATVAGDADPNPENPDAQVPASSAQAAAPTAGAAVPTGGASTRSTQNPGAGAAPANTTNVNVQGGNATGGAATAPTKAGDINAQGPAGTAAAKPQTGAAAQALQKTAQATKGANAEKAGQTLYAQVKSQVGQLDKKGKQRILQLLQKSLAQPAPAAQAAPIQPAAQAAPTPAAAPAAQAAPTTPADATAAPTGEPSKPKRTRNKKTVAAPAAAASAQDIEADRNRLMGNFTDSVQRHKQKMVSEGVRNGTYSIFRKY